MFCARCVFGQIMLTRLTLILIILATAGPAAGETYMERLGRRALDWQKELPAIRDSAAEAAEKIMAGGKLYAAGPQPGFVSEIKWRAGGLMLMDSDPKSLTGMDIVIAATTARDSAGLEELLDAADKAGATVILFANGFAPPAPLKRGKLRILPVEPFAADPRRVSVESMSNLVGAWGWTAEFIAACVERGKMPGIFQSFGMPGGRKRSEALRECAFHGTSSVTPGDAKDLGLRFFQAVSDSLKTALAQNRAGFGKAAEMIMACRKAGGAVRISGIGHMFPAELRQPQAPDWFTHVSSPTNGADNDINVFLGYQVFPYELLNAAPGRRFVVTSSDPPPAEFTARPGNIYLDQCWEIRDACLRLKGYDVPVIPISGIMTTAIYWQLVENLVN